MVPAWHPLADEDVLRPEQIAELPLRLAARDANPPFRDLITTVLRDAGAELPVGPPFTHLQGTLADIATDPTASWTGSTAPVTCHRPSTSRFVRWRRREHASLVVPPGPAGPALRLLLDSFRG